MLGVIDPLEMSSKQETTSKTSYGRLFREILQDPGGWTQGELAKLLGVSQPSISMRMSGKTLPEPTTRAILCLARKLLEQVPEEDRVRFIKEAIEDMHALDNLPDE